MEQIEINDKLTLTNININNDSDTISNNLIKSSIDINKLKYIIENAESESDIINQLSSINAFSINWNGAKLSNVDTIINTSADLLSLLDTTYNISYTLINKYNDLLQKYKDLLNKYNGK